MKRILLASHGHMASGMKSALKILLGNVDHIDTIDAYVDESRVTDHIQAFMDTVKEEDQVLMMSDLHGGSVSQAMFPYTVRPNTYLIAGVNLALVLELAFDKEATTKEQLEHCIAGAKDMLLMVEDKEVSEDAFF